MVRFFLLLLLSALCSCSDWHSMQRLDTIEPLIQSDPIAARRQLDSLRTFDADIANSPKLQARLNLLDAQLKYKNYTDLPHTDNDSTLPHLAQELAGQFDALKAEYIGHRTAEERLNLQLGIIIAAMLIMALSSLSIILFRHRQRNKIRHQNDLPVPSLSPEEIEAAVETIKNSGCVRHIMELVQNNQILNDDAREELNQLFEQYHPTFNRELHRRLNLTPDKMAICQLQKLGFLNVKIAILMAVTPNAISNTSKRNCDEYLGYEETAKKWREIIRSL